MPFVTPDTSSPTGITNLAGTFVFLTGGTYEVAIGIESNTLDGNGNPATGFFDLVLNPGTDNIIIKEIRGTAVFTRGIDPVVAQFTVEAGDSVQLQFSGSNPAGGTSTTLESFFSGGNVVVGPHPELNDLAFIQFVKIS